MHNSMAHRRATMAYFRRCTTHVDQSIYHYVHDPQVADDVHAAIPQRNVDRRNAGQTDALCRRSAAVRPAHPCRVRSTRDLCCLTNSLQLAACQH